METFTIPPALLPHYTYQEYKDWEGQWELIAGIPFAMSPLPTFKHQRINSRIVHFLTEALEQNNSCPHCEAMMPIDWKIKDDTIVQPDACIICEETDTETAFIRNIPKVVFEILSPSTRKKDLTIKYALYESVGLPYYVIIDPDIQKATVYQYQENKFVQVLETQKKNYTFDIGECFFTFDFSKIWSRTI